MSATLVRRCLCAAVVITSLAAMGCESTEDDKTPDRQRDRLERRERRERAQDVERDRLRDSDRPDQVIGRRDRDRDLDRAGTRRGLDEVPTTAARVDEAANAGRLTYTPTRDGTLYVYDTDDDRVVFSTRVRRDERFVLDADAGRATLDSRTVLGTGLSPSHRYRLYFDRGRD